MPSSRNPGRAQLKPGADFNQRAIPVTQQPAGIWFRVHRSGVPGAQFGKFPHHRFSHPNCRLPLCYVGASIQTCLWEYFGDDVFIGQRVISATKWDGCCVSQIFVAELRVCAFSLERTREAMSVDKGSLMAADLGIPQAWGLAVQGHPAGFEAIRYASRFLDQSCLALFDRGGLQAKLQVKPLGALRSLDAAVDWLDERKAALV